MVYGQPPHAQIPASYYYPQSQLQQSSQPPAAAGSSSAITGVGDQFSPNYGPSYSPILSYPSDYYGVDPAQLNAQQLQYLAQQTYQAPAQSSIAYQQQQYQQQAQAPSAPSPSTPGMYSSSSASNSSPSMPGSPPQPAFDGNMVFWTSRDLRDTIIWGDEVVSAKSKRHIEYKFTTPRGYANSTRTTIDNVFGGRLGGPLTAEEYMSAGTVKTRRMAEFVWASPTQLGSCEFGNGMEVPMVSFLLDGTTRDCSRFFVLSDGSKRCFEWLRDPIQPEVFTLYDVPGGRLHAKYVGGPFEHKNLCPYMQYYWIQDDPLLIFALMAIIIRRWSDRYQ